MVLSHSVEEAMPLWMLEADLFVRGVRKYAGNPDIKGLCGFALQGEIGLSHLDKIVSSRINWNPDEDYVALMKNYLISCYGMAAQQTLAALRANSSVLSEFFSDYAGLTSLTGGYGNGSRGYATRLWNIIGKEAVRDILSMPEEKMVEYSKERLSSLIPMQQESSNEMQAAMKTAKYPSDKLKADHSDALHIMRMWVRFFESRLRLIEALEVGFNERGIDQISQKINSAIEYSKEMQMEISEITHFVKVFDYDDNGARNSLIKSIDEEIDFLKNFDPERILASLANDIGHGSPEFDIITNLVCPNPINRMGFFCYELSLSADEVNISIYSVNGRLIRKISKASANRGYNEELWDTRDENGMALSSGTYLYKITANRDNKKIQKIGKLSILR